MTAFIKEATKADAELLNACNNGDESDFLSLFSSQTGDQTDRDGEKKS
jgi:hypothetical protein